MNYEKGSEEYMNIIKFLIGLLAILLVLWFVQGAFASQEETCPKTGGWTKVDGVMPSHTTEGSIITQVCVKGGQTKLFFTENGDNGCWKVMGIGTTGAYAQKTGEGRNCKDISHASFFVGIPSSPTVSPTSGISPTVTQGISPTTEPSVSPTVEVTRSIVHPSATPFHPTPTAFHPTPTVHYQPYVEQKAKPGSKGA